MGDGGTISLKGTGGGLYSNSSGTTNYGVELAGATLIAGNGGATVNTINISGAGGMGTTGVHHGVNIPSLLTVTLNGTGPSNALNFINCAGGPGGPGNYGVNFAGALTLASGSLNFLNVVGGGNTATTGNYGLFIGSTVIAPVIIGRDIAGGPGTNNNWGLNVAGTLGSAATNVLIMAASSLGYGSNEYGINATGAVTAARARRWSSRV